MLNQVCLAPNPKSNSLSTSTILSPVPKQLDIQAPNILLTGATSKHITSSINATANTLPISAGQVTPTSPLTTTLTYPIFQPSNQSSSHSISSLDPNQVDHGPSLSIFLPCNPCHTSEHTFSSIALTDSQKTPAKKHFQKSSNSPKKTKPPKPHNFAENPQIGFNHKQLNLKRSRLFGELFPHKRGSGHFSLASLTPDEKEIPIPMDSTPEHDLHLPARSYFKTTRKGMKSKPTTLPMVPPAALLIEELETEESNKLGDLVVTPSCI